jgi:hypothetical protein
MLDFVPQADLQYLTDAITAKSTAALTKDTGIANGLYQPQGIFHLGRCQPAHHLNVGSPVRDSFCLLF